MADNCGVAEGGDGYFGGPQVYPWGSILPYLLQDSFRPELPL